MNNIAFNSRDLTYVLCDNLSTGFMKVFFGDLL